MIRCPYCWTQNDGKPFARKTVWADIERYLDPGYALYRCDECDLIYAAPITSENIANLHRYYVEQYNTHDRGSSPEDMVAAVWSETAVKRLARPILNRLRALTWHSSNLARDFGQGRAPEALSLLHRRRARSVLDIGCAAGGFVRSAHFMGMKAYGIEPDIRIVKALRKQGINKVTGGFFPETIGPLNHYDALTMFAVLFYIPEISPRLFRACHELLSGCGTLIIFEPNTNCLDAPELATTLASPLTLNFTSPAFMQRAARDAGFSAYEHVPCRGEPFYGFHVMTT